MQVTILNYKLSRRTLVQAFVDIEIDGWLRINGIHFERERTLRAPQLTPWIQGQRLFIPAVEIIDPAIESAILDAIDAHIETLPAEQRVIPAKPPRVDKVKPPANPAPPQPKQAQPEPAMEIKTLPPHSLLNQASTLPPPLKPRSPKNGVRI